MVRAEDLLWPLLLGRDAPDFTALLLQAASEEGVWAADTDPGGEGTFQDPGGAHPAHRVLWLEAAWLQDSDFRWAQEKDPSLQRTHQSIAVDGGQVKDARMAARLQQIEQVQGLWWRLVPLTPRNSEGRQLVVPEGFRGQVLRAAHNSPWVGHQGPRRRRLKCCISSSGPLSPPM